MESNSTPNDRVAGARPMDYFRVVRERKWAVVVVLILVVGAVAAYSFLKTPVYQASAEVLRLTASLDETLFGNTVFQVRDASRELQTGANLVKLNVVATMVKEDLNSGRSTESLLAMTKATAIAETDLIRISSESTDPEEAAAVANSFARQFIRYRQDAYRAILAAADEQVVAELAGMTPEELLSERGVTLAQKHEELGILWAMQTGGFELVQTAEVPADPVAPRPVRNTGFALAGGLILGILLAFLIDYVDRRIKTEEQLEREFGMPVLASVPRVGKRFAFNNGSHARDMIGFAKAESPFLEAYRTLRSNLRFYQTDQPARVLLVTSGLAQEGKTVTAINLALSLALTGARVSLIETDLRRPMTDQYLGLRNDVGVSTVLAGSSAFKDSVQAVRVSHLVPDARLATKAQNTGATAQAVVLCMTSGPLPPNPAELLASPRMLELLKTAAAHTEYVVVDSPPVLLVSDALNVAEHTDGVIVAAKIKSTTVDEAREVRTVLERAGCRALGIVANGVDKRPEGYYQGYYKSRPRAGGIS
ncbi:MAG: polysaccharide biosynthesis tyrosine autokinase [Armatimonadetes bacterium]|nr:polysaccharide biosynthesis tyrosine autokinase [Armatimonadota bacterium]